MSWQPNTTVTINGQDFTGRAVDRVSITRGRDTVYSPARAGYASMTILDVTEGSAGFGIGASVQVAAEDSAGQPVVLFTGFVSDFTSQVVSAQPEPVIVYRLNCVGPLSILNRRSVFQDGRAQELDGARVLAAVNAALPVIWSEYSLTQTWAQAGNVTWATVDPGFDPNLIDPGIYEIVPLEASDEGYEALNLVSLISESAKGLLFETADGFIGYADADRRPANATAGFLDVPFGLLTVNGLTIGSSLADLTNRVFVEYGDEDVVTDEDLTSIVRFGLQESIVRTILARQEDAEARADDILFSRSRPPRELERLPLNLRADIGDTLRDNLLAINSNDAVQVTGLPAKLGFGENRFRGFVEGITFNLSTFEATMSLFVSDELLSFGSVLWAQVADNITFTNVNPTLTWEDARRVTT